MLGSPSRARRSARVRVPVAAVSLALLIPGCVKPAAEKKDPSPWEAPKPAPVTPAKSFDASKVGTRDDIFEISQFWSQVPWLFRGDMPVGFKVPTYFRSTESQKGAFVSGPITVSIFRLDRAQTPDMARQLAYRWELDPAAAMPFRVTKTTLLGYGYLLIMNWPEELDVAGREVEIIVSYQRGDGRRIESQVKRLRVPKPVGFAAPPERKG